MDPMVHRVFGFTTLLRVPFLKVKIEVGFIVFGRVDGGEVFKSLSVIVKNDDSGKQSFDLFEN